MIDYFIFIYSPIPIDFNSGKTQRQNIWKYYINILVPLKRKGRKIQSLLNTFSFKNHLRKSKNYNPDKQNNTAIFICPKKLLKVKLKVKSITRLDYLLIHKEFLQHYLRNTHKTCYTLPEQQ